MSSTDFEAVIGLEIHAQLSTRTKLFCRCPSHFGAEPNENTCPVCAGHPGALPVLNLKAIDAGILAGLALGCRINTSSVFARKNYFYPDLPKGYQISQFDLPLCEDGHIDLSESRRVRVQRIHIEEDAGKSQHFQGHSLVNLNRAATPLIEIVSHPDMSSPEEAGAYMRKVRTTLMYIGVNDGNLQEGNLRCDANVSVRPRGSKKLGTRAEVKNVNSFRFLEKAVEYEINRQIEVIKAGGVIALETRGYDSAKNVTYSLRSKEEAHDYRYFPEPDLLPVVLTEARISNARSTMVELPDAKRARYINELGLSAYDAGVITESLQLAQFFDAAYTACSESKLVANWVTGELLRLAKGVRSDEDESSLGRIPVKAADLGALIKLIKSGAISNNIAKIIFEEMYATGRDPESIVKEKGLTQVSDTAAIEAEVESILAAHAMQVAEFRSGKDKVYGFLVGQVMRAMKGKGNPTLINEILAKKLKL